MSLYYPFLKGEERDDEEGERERGDKYKKIRCETYENIRWIVERGKGIGGREKKQDREGRGLMARLAEGERAHINDVDAAGSKSELMGLIFLGGWWHHPPLEIDF